MVVHSVVIHVAIDKRDPSVVVIFPGGAQGSGIQLRDRGGGVFDPAFMIASEHHD